MISLFFFCIASMLFRSMLSEYAWKFLHGSQFGDCRGTYGEEFSQSNYPGARRSVMSWNFPGDEYTYLFGGYGCLGSDQIEGYLSDFWVVKQEQQDDEELPSWKFVHRTPSSHDNLYINQITIRGSTVYSLSNFPGGRIGSAVTTRGTNELILFGGYGYASVSTSNFGYLQDLWMIRASDFYADEIMVKLDDDLRGDYDRWRSWGDRRRRSLVFDDDESGRRPMSYYNYPSSRYYSAIWTTLDENDVIIFGGYGTDPLVSYSYGYLNDVMVIELSSNDGYWANGDNDLNNYGVLSNPNDFHIDNVPGARFGMLYWTKGSYGYLYGGYGNDVTDQAAGKKQLTDLWVINRSNYYMKMLAVADYEVSYTNNYGDLVPNNVDLPDDLPYAFRSSHFMRDGDVDGRIFFYGGSDFSGDNYFGDLWSLVIVGSNENAEFRYHRFASSGTSSEKSFGYQNEPYSSSQPFLPSFFDEEIVSNVPPNYEGSYTRNVSPGASRDGTFLVLGTGTQPCYYWSGKTSTGLPASLTLSGSNDLWIVKDEYRWDCNGVDSQNVSSLCSGRDGSLCLLNGTCVCPSGYFGENCEDYYCFGILHSNHSHACSNHGSCYDHDKCDCDPGYRIDEDCGDYHCWNISFSNREEVCSRHGDCLRPDICNCTYGYFSKDCSEHECFEIHFNHSSVCSRHGECIRPDKCNCTDEYFSEDCSEHECFEINFNHSSVCSRHGECIRPDICNCTDDYFSDDCGEYKCFHLLFNHSSVCSEHGECIGPDICNCTDGYFSDDCREYKCFEIMYNESSVCSRNGECIRPDTCNCSVGYDYFEDCGLFYCGNILFFNESVCSGHGECVAQDNCVYDTCFDLLYNHSLACSGRGDCISNDNCSCYENYFGNDCSLTTCFNISSSEEDLDDVCSGNGVCRSFDNCSCEENYFGKDCSLFNCYGELMSDSDASCGQNGTCISHNECRCDVSYYGKVCSLFNCSSISRNHSSVCQGHGDCIHPENCKCYDDDGSIPPNEYPDLEFSNHGGYYGVDCESRISSIGHFVGSSFVRIPFDIVSEDFVFVEHSYPTLMFYCFGEENKYYPILIDNSWNRYLLGISPTDNSPGCVWGKYDVTISEIVVVNDSYSYETSKLVNKIIYVDIDITHLKRHRLEIGSVLLVQPISDFVNISVKINHTVAYTSPDGDNQGEDEDGDDDGDEDESGGFVYESLFSLFAIFGMYIAIFAYCGVLCFVFCGLSMMCSFSLLCAKCLKLRRREKSLQDLVFGDELGEDSCEMEKKQFGLFGGRRNSKRKSMKYKLKNVANVEFNIDLFKIDNKDIRLVKIIGSGGSSSTIYLARWKSLDVAVKVFRTTTLFRSSTPSNDLEPDYEFDEFEREINILSSISHPHIITVYGCCVHPPKVCLVLEYCKHGDLRSYFLKCKLKSLDFFDYQYKLLFLSIVCGAIEYLHSRQIIHRDMKADNILLKEDLSPKLIDFGVSKVLARHSGAMNNTRRVGTSAYIAPEVIRGKYDEQADVYSLAIVFFEVMTEIFDPYKERLKRSKYGNNNNNGVAPAIEFIVHQDPNFRPVIPTEFTNAHPKVSEFMEQMWDHEPNNRPKINVAKQFLEDQLTMIGKEDKLGLVTLKECDTLKERESDEEKEDDDEDGKNSVQSLSSAAVVEEKSGDDDVGEKESEDDDEDDDDDDVEEGGDQDDDQDDDDQEDVVVDGSSSSSSSPSTTLISGNSVDGRVDENYNLV